MYLLHLQQHCHCSLLFSNPACSPIYSHLSATLQGLPVIRSYSMQSVFMDQFYDYQNRNTQTWYLFSTLVRYSSRHYHNIATLKQLCRGGSYSDNYIYRWSAIINDAICVTFLVVFMFASVPLAISENPFLIHI